MENRFNYFENPIRKTVFRLVGVVLRLLGFVIVGAFLSRVLLSVFTDINIADSEKIIFEIDNRAEARNALLLIQALNTIFVYFALPITYIYLFRKDLKRVFSIKEKKLGNFILLSFFVFLAALPFISQLIEINQQIQLPERFSELQLEILRLEEHAQKVTQLVMYYDSWYEIIPILFVVAVLAGIGEELLFRGIIQNEINGIVKNPHVAIWISAILFSFIHFQFQGFLPRMVLGGLLGYLYYWSGSLLVPILIHFINNAFIFALLNYESYQGGIFGDTSASLGITLVASVICIILLLACYKLFKSVKRRSISSNSVSQGI